MIGAEKEDIVQEGLIGLFKAIKNYQTNKQSSFKNFANMCIERQLITAIKSSNRQKHMPHKWQEWSWFDWNIKYELDRRSFRYNYSKGIL